MKKTNRVNHGVEAIPSNIRDEVISFYLEDDIENPGIVMISGTLGKNSELKNVTDLSGKKLKALRAKYLNNGLYMYTLMTRNMTFVNSTPNMKTMYSLFTRYLKVVKEIQLRKDKYREQKLGK